MRRSGTPPTQAITVAPSPNPSAAPVGGNPAVQPELGPIALRDVVSQQPHAFSLVHNGNIHRAVVVVSPRRQARGLRVAARGSDSKAQDRRRNCPGSSKTRTRAMGASRRGRRFLLFEGASVGNDEIRPAIRVEINEARSPPDFLQRRLPDAHDCGHVGEVQFRSVGHSFLLRKQGLVQRKPLRDPVRNEKIVVAIAVEIPCCQAHGAAVLLDPCTFAGVNEGPVVVQVELVLRNVIGHIEIGPAIAVEVVPESAQAAAFRIRQRQAPRQLP